MAVSFMKNPKAATVWFWCWRERPERLENELLMSHFTSWELFLLREISSELSHVVQLHPTMNGVGKWYQCTYLFLNESRILAVSVSALHSRVCVFRVLVGGFILMNHKWFIKLNHLWIFWLFFFFYQRDKMIWLTFKDICVPQRLKYSNFSAVRPKFCFIAKFLQK